MGTKQTQNCVGGTKFNFKDRECCFQMFCSSSDKKDNIQKFCIAGTLPSPKLHEIR